MRLLRAARGEYWTIGLPVHTPDVVVIGAGFGGLATALKLAELGADVVICESLRYPGGCASTFTRGGYKFEAGATLFSGLGPGQLFSDWNRKWDLGVEFEPLDPIVEFRTRDWMLDVPPDRSEFLSRFAALPGANAAQLDRFFGTQHRVATALWPLFADPSLLPPLSARAAGRHIGRLPTYAPVARWIGRPLSEVVARHGLGDWSPLRVYLDAVCQITVQAPSHEAEAPFAMAAMDYFFRGTGHVRGGIGSLAWGLVEAIRRAGGRVMLSNRVKEIRRDDGAWRVETRRGEFVTKTVVANLLPQALARVTKPSLAASVRDVTESVESGWGAAMLYIVIEGDSLGGSEARHFQLVADEGRPLVEGNHVFCSVSGRNEPDPRAPWAAHGDSLDPRSDDDVVVARWR